MVYSKLVRSTGKTAQGLNLAYEVGAGDGLFSRYMASELSWVRGHPVGDCCGIWRMDWLVVGWEKSSPLLGDQGSQSLLCVLLWCESRGRTSLCRHDCDLLVSLDNYRCWAIFRVLGHFSMFFEKMTIVELGCVFTINLRVLYLFWMLDISFFFFKYKEESGEFYF